MRPNSQETPQADPRTDVLARWGNQSLVLANGFTPVATSFLWYAAHLEPNGLNPGEIVFVLHLMSHKRTTEEPYPSYERISKRMGVSAGYCRKIARSLERRGFLVRTRRTGRSNSYDLNPLFVRLGAKVSATWEAARKAPVG